jgi:hypothetical protein
MYSQGRSRSASLAAVHKKYSSLKLENFKYRPLGDALTSTYFMNAAVLST